MKGAELKQMEKVAELTGGEQKVNKEDCRVY